LFLPDGAKNAQKDVAAAEVESPEGKPVLHDGGPLKGNPGGPTGGQ